MGGISGGSGGGGAPTTAGYIVTSADAGLTAERVLTAGANITLTDAGPGGALTVAAAGGGGAASGVYANVGLIGANNAVTPLTQYDFSATAVVLRNTSNEIVVRYNVATVTNDVAAAGPVANGRDQAAAFAANSWIHFYWIWNGTTLATISSAVAPPTGPTLPAGYTHWAYIGAIRFNASSQLMQTRISGNNVYYRNNGLTQVLSGGSATGATAVDVSSFVPPNASHIFLESRLLYQNAAVNADNNVRFAFVSGDDYFFMRLITQVANQNFEYSGQIVIPNATQQIFYNWSVAAGTRSAFLYINGYGVHN